MGDAQKAVSHKVVGNVDVQITPARVIISGTAYAVRNITSVEREELSPEWPVADMRVMAAGLILIGVLLHLVFSLTKTAWVVSSLGIVVGLGTLLPTRWRWPTYHIHMRTNAGEVLTIRTQDARYAEEVLSGINQAMESYQAEASAD